MAQSTDVPSGFAAQLIAALEDAQASASTAKPRNQLAQAAWSKLQFDFPVVSGEELEALVQEYASGARQDNSPRFLAVLRESTGAAPPADASPAAPAAGSGEEGRSRALVPLYQQLYAVSVVQCLKDCLEVPHAAAAAAWLAGLQPGEAGAAGTGGESALAGEGSSRLEEVLAAAAEGAAATQQIEMEHRLSQQEDDDSTAYEPLEPSQQQQRWQAPGTAARQPRPLAPQQSSSSGGQASGQGLPDQLVRLGEHLQYHCMSDSTAWRELRLMQRLAGCLAAARRHPRFLELHGAAQPLLRLATDRIAAQPADLEGGLPSLLDALGVPGSSSGVSASSNRQEAAVAAAAAELALAAAVALAAQIAVPSARRRLWQEVHQRLLPVAALQLEQQQVALARQARANSGGMAAAAAAAGAGAASASLQPSPQQLFPVMLPCQLLYFYVLQAASAGSGGGGGQQLQEALLNKGGLLRSLVLLFVQLGEQPGAEPLRCALLLACAAAQPLADWAAAVPGFSAAAAAPELQPGGAAQLHGALWRVLLAREGGQLAELLGDATPADKVPAVYQALQLMADVTAVWRRGPGQAALWGPGVDAALRQLAATLREQYGKPAAVDAADTTMAADAAGPDGGDEHSGSSDSDDGDAKKLAAVAAGEQAGVLAVRRARQLQPACLKLVKDLLQAGQQGGGAPGKHD